MIAELDREIIKIIHHKWRREAEIMAAAQPEMERLKKEYRELQNQKDELLKEYKKLNRL